MKDMEGRREESEEISISKEADILGWMVDSQYNLRRGDR